MSEANSYAGTVGTWVVGFLVLFAGYLIAHIAVRRGWSYMTPNAPNYIDEIKETNRLLADLIKKVEMQTQATEANRNILGNIKRIAAEVQNDAGGMLVIQRMPRSGGQNQGAAHSQQV